jgi:hypothetical protein
VFGVAAASRNTRFQAARNGLTWAGLTPADRASFAWRLPSVDRQPGFPRFHRVVDTHTMNGCGEIVTINHVRRRASVMRFNLI